MSTAVEIAIAQRKEQERQIHADLLRQNGDAMEAMFSAKHAMFLAVDAYFRSVVDYNLSRGASVEASRKSAEQAIEQLYDYGTFTDAIQESYDTYIGA